jgi:hypothetical protein
LASSLPGELAQPQSTPITPAKSASAREEIEPDVA